MFFRRVEIRIYLSFLKPLGLIRYLLLLFLGPLMLFSQEDCLLGIGGKDDEMIRTVFELTDEQIEQMRNWGAELQFRNEIFEIKAQNLLKNHAQSSVEDLLIMSHKYKALLDSMQNNIKLLDRRMLGIFTNEQYNLYIMLCNQVNRSPLYAPRSMNEK